MDLPVTLRLDHSGEKTGGVVLMLDNGERVNLTMTALGKLTHPIILKPRNLVLKGRSARPMLQLEWPSATEQPPQAQLASTGGVSFQTEPWSLQAKPNDKGMPAIWRARLVVMDRPDEAGEGELTVTVGDLPPSVMQVSWTARAPRTLPQAPSPAGPAASP